MSLFFLGLGTVCGLVATVLTVFVSWNAVVPMLFGLPQISVLQSFFLTFLVRTLVSSKPLFHVDFTKRGVTQ